MRISFSIDKNVANIFPNMRVGVCIGRAIDNFGTPDLDQLISDTKQWLCNEFNGDFKNITQNKNIECWHEAYRKIGINPKKNTPSLDNLIQRILKKDYFPRISKIVDLYLITELKYLIPYGGYDLANINGSIKLCLSPGNEVFQPVGEESLTEYTQPNEVIYRDSEKVLTRRWNYKDSNLSKINDHTTDFVLMCEAPDERIGDQTIRESLDYLSQLLAGYSTQKPKIDTYIVNVSENLEYNWEV